MSRIVFQKSYIVIIPSFDKTDTHKHPFMHMFFGKSGCRITVDKKDIQGNAILLDSNVKHVVKEGNDCDFFLLIDPTSTIAEQFLDKFLQGSTYHDVTGDIAVIPEDMKSLTDEEIVEIVENVLLALSITMEETCTKDERIKQVIDKIISGEWLSYSVREIAESVFLSESRLTHLFKEQVGVSLKSYILIRRMERAYRFVSSGGKITRAAQEGGFSSSAHLAYTCKTLTGVSITDVLKSSEK